MRNIVDRRSLPDDVQERLDSATAKLTENPDAREAAKTYRRARDSAWFSPVIDALKSMVGTGGCCMFCSRSEASNVEHYRPKSLFPTFAMRWENFLWVCGVCNQAKGEKFPLGTSQIVNPVDENPWDFMLIDEFGVMTARYLPSEDEVSPRASSTIDVVKLNRDGLLFSRKRRLTELSAQVIGWCNGLKEGKANTSDARQWIVDRLNDPFQVDVADYFLNGPGRKESPFRELFELLDSP